MSREAVTHRLKQMEGLWLLSRALADAKVVQKDVVGKNRSLEMQAAIRDILLLEWNPSAPSRGAGADRSYDRYIASILRILVGSRCEDDLVECLQRMTNNEAGIAARDIECLQQVAKSLLELNVRLN